MFYSDSSVDTSGVTSLDVYNAAVGGDEMALEVIRRFRFYLGIVMGGLVN